MTQCFGTVIVAFERKFVESGFEFMGAEVQSPLKGVRTTTVWNHIEGGMSYAYGLPLLVIREEGLLVEGAIEETGNWTVLEVPLRDSELHTDRFRTIFSEWLEEVLTLERGGRGDGPTQHVRQQESGAIDPSELTLAQIVGALTVRQIVTIVGAIIAFASAVGVVVGFGR